MRATAPSDLWLRQFPRHALIVLALGLLLLGRAAFAGGEMAYGQGLLWKIERDSIERDSLAPSYLFGTIHITDERVLNLPAEVTQAFDGARSATFEVIMTDELRMDLAKAMIVAPDRTLDRVLSPALYDAAMAAGARYGLAPAQLRYFKPWALAMFLSVPQAEFARSATGVLPLDQALQDRAQAQGKPVHQLETGAELGKLPDGLQPAVGGLGDSLLRRVEEVGVGSLAGSSHPTSQLIQLGEAEAVGSFHDQRVDLGKVEPGYDDGRRHQDVVLAVPEVEHHLLQLALVHLPVGDGETGVGYQLLQPGHRMVDGLHPVVHVEDLPLAQYLAANRRRDGLGVVRSHIGQDGVAIFGRRPDLADVPDPGERQLQGARDRGCGEGEGIHRGTDHLQLVLGRDTEALLFVNDEQPEILERDVV